MTPDATRALPKALREELAGRVPGWRFGPPSYAGTCPTCGGHLWRRFEWRADDRRGEPKVAEFHEGGAQEAAACWQRARRA